MQEVKAHLTEKGLEFKDFGTDSTEATDYPIYAKRVAKAILSGECDRGIVMCTTGIGMSIAANKIKGIRCALLSDLKSAELTRQHNDTNMMALGAGVVDEALAYQLVDTWLTTEFSGAERHARRNSLTMALENE
jgi:ribose 5-phosphate isomerase B